MVHFPAGLPRQLKCYALINLAGNSLKKLLTGMAQTSQALVKGGRVWVECVCGGACMGTIQ